MLGLEQYEPAFRDNAIDGAVLPQLTPDDLKDIGVTQVGHRRWRKRRAIFWPGFQIAQSKSSKTGSCSHRY